MDKTYADIVRLLLNVVPDVFMGDVFAIKGGTAINLFTRDMPRLSVDIDVVFTPWEVPRDEALKTIANEIAAIEARLADGGLATRTIKTSRTDESKLLVSNGDVQVKIEVNLVFRGTVLPIEERPLVSETADMFSVELEAPVLAVDELYGGKLVAALDRQHPRDIFDVWQMYESGGLLDGMVECFVIYLAGHNRPTHEVLFANPIDIRVAYESSFVGMTREPVSLETLESVRERLLQEIPMRLTDEHKAFLTGLTRAKPNWSLLQCPHASKLPALQWKLLNLERFKQSKPTVFERQAAELERLLG